MEPEEQHHRTATLRVIRCDEGHLIGGDSEQELLAHAKTHFLWAHPLVPARLSRREILAMEIGTEQPGTLAALQGAPMKRLVRTPRSRDRHRPSPARGSSARRALLERVVEAYAKVLLWPTARKVAFTTGLILPVQLAGSLFVHFANRGVRAIDASMVDRHLLVWWFAIAALFLISAIASRGGREARWTVYLLIVVYGTGAGWLIHLFGTISTALYAFVPLTILYVTLFFGRGAGLVAMVYALVETAALSGLELAHVLAYAPALRIRDVGAQLDARMSAAIFVTVGLVFLFAFGLALLSLSVRQRQHERLSDAHGDLMKAKERLERAAEAIRRYVPSQLAEKILAGGYAEDSRPERRRVTVLFSDVEGFTKAADEMEPEELSELLNDYLSEMGAIADAQGGTVAQISGDGILVLFGAPDTAGASDDALRAVHTALGMQHRMAELRGKWFDEGIQAPFRIRIGLNTGLASVGNFGWQGRRVYTAVGNQVNLAARIQARCEPGGVLIGHATWGLVKEAVRCADRGEIEVKGLHYPVRVYEVGAFVSAPSTLGTVVNLDARR